MPTKQETFNFVPLRMVETLMPWAETIGVSSVARGPGGFIEQFQKAKGDESKLKKMTFSKNQSWWDRRNGFIKRHMAQVKKRKEPLWRNGIPTRRHFALLMWAYTPDEKSFYDWFESNFVR